MATVSEYTMIRRLLYADKDRLKDAFDVSSAPRGVYILTCKSNSNHVITIASTRSPYSAVVNANFGSSHMAGSNNYPDLENVGRRLANIFNLTIDW